MRRTIVTPPPHTMKKLGRLALAMGLVGLVGCTSDDDDDTMEMVDSSVGDSGAENDASTSEPDAGTETDGGEEPSGDCDTTWKAIQKTVFEGRGCTASSCHDADDPQGGLDLTAGVAYDNLIHAESQAGIDMPLVTPGEEEQSLLYLKLQAKTEGTELPDGAGSPMPTSDDAVSAEELAALRAWIRGGAAEDTVVDGTQDLLDCELPEQADPNKVVPPPVPDPEEGFQHYSGSWTVEPNSEDEVCFGTYYDLSDVAPDWAKVDCEIGGVEQTCVAYRKRSLSQDAQSHHSIIDVYGGSAPPSDPSWREWTCSGGELDGTSCDPTQLGVSAEEGGADCGERSICQSEVVSGFVCSNVGPQDTRSATVGVGGAQTPVSSVDYPEGVYGVLPVKGIVMWNSHAFNLTEKPTTIEQYNNFWYAQPEDQKYRMRGIFDAEHIFAMEVPPFQKQELCGSWTLPRYARLVNLNSHMHKRGVRWRTWLPPNETDCTPPSCEPNEEDPIYESRNYSDPLYLDFDPPMEFNQEDDTERTLKYCAVYDNGADDPSTVRRATGLPEGADPCTPTHCVGGPDQGEECSDDSECAGDGVCDACTLEGGFTTEEEMMILQGRYYIETPEE